MSEPIKADFAQVSIPLWIWNEIQPIASFMEELGPEIQIDYKVWPKGSPEPHGITSEAPF